MKNNITFAKSVKRFVLNALGMDINKDGMIIELKTGQKVLNRHGKEVHIDKFCGYCKGFGIVEEGLDAIVELSDYIKEQEKLNE
jgi:hypothetical protein